MMKLRKLLEAQGWQCIADSKAPTMVKYHGRIRLKVELDADTGWLEIRRGAKLLDGMIEVQTIGEIEDAVDMLASYVEFGPCRKLVDVSQFR